MTSEHFSVYQFFQDESYECVRHRVDRDTAVKAALHYATSVAAKLGVTRRVIITDSGDLTCFEWKYGEGAVFPPAENPNV